MANPAYHAIVVSMATGLLVFAFLAISLRAFFPPDGSGRGLLRTLSGPAETVAVWAAAAGVLFFVAAMVVGFQLRPLEAFLNSPISKNKIMASFIALAFWGNFLLLRVVCGQRLWRVPVLKSAYWLAALGGFVFLLIVNSVGGDLGGIPSGFEQLAAGLGIATRETYYLPLWTVWLFFALGIGALLIGLAGGLLARRGRPGGS